MTNQNKIEKILRPRDDEETRLIIQMLFDRGFSPTRPSDHQIKIRDVNFYFGKGTITIDPCERHPDKGFEALLKLLNQKYPPQLNIFCETLTV